MAEALVGGAFLSATLQVLLDRLASPVVINFFRGKKHGDRVPLLHKKLKLSLLGLKAVLNDAENKQITNPAVKEWVEELKDVIYHADDIVDEIATEALRSKSEADYQSSSSTSSHSRLSQVLSLIPLTLTSSVSTTASLFDAGIESRLEKIIHDLEYFAQKKDVLGLREVRGHNNWFHKSQTSSLVDESGVYGRDFDKEDVMKVLLSDDDSGGCNEIGVIAIVGMGGVGKTTLAQLLYNDDRVVDHFKMKAWVCVSEEFDVLSVTRSILEAVTGQACDAKNLDVIQVKLKELLSGKKYFIVLDDVWNENYGHWESLSQPFRYGTHGSRIIVTTRKDRVASVMKTVHIHRLQELPFEDCWKLFAKYAFEKENFNSHPNLENIGKEIVKKCKGLPLAAKTLAGLLRSKRDAEDWNNVLKSAIWDLPEDNILPALRLSYRYLPPHVKRCFAYCSIFPKDYEFKIGELVLLWIAEGFVKPRSNTTMEEVGYECFNELLSVSLFQQSAKASFFVMHDLVNDLAQSVSGDFCLRLENDKPHIIADKVRHFSYARGMFDDFQRFKVINEAKFLRTFLPLGRRYAWNWLSKMVLDVILSRLICLRVLSLPHYRIFELPHSIGNLVHLRYLDLSYTKIQQLPESVCDLCNLQTLLLIDCYNLTTLPTEIGKLIFLRHLDISGTDKLREMPMQMSRLKDLQTLTAFVVGKCSGSGINELKEFHHLSGSLSISCLQNITSSMDAMEAKLKEKKLLETLVLSWNIGIPNDSESERDLLDKLQPHTNLKHLKDCEDCFFLPSLGQLSSLKHLTISGMPRITKVGHEFYGDCSLSKPFQSLETLSFFEMLDWEEWYILGDGEFSGLKELRVTNCPKLIGGLPKHIPSWVRVEIGDCPGLMASLPRTCAANQLVLWGCDSVELGWQGLSSLVNLEISSASLKELTPELYTLINLKELMIVQCPDLLLFPDTRLPPMLTGLTIIDCRAICFLPERVMRLNSCLKRLSVRACPKLVFPLSEEMENCYTSLEYLSLETCDSLPSLPLELFPKLQSLRIKDCRNFETLLTLNRLGFQNSASLEWLCLDGCSNMESFSQQVLIAPNLKTFYLLNCKKLKSLPDRMHSLTSLQSLRIWNCPGLESFPEGGLPSSLHSLEIRNCAKLVAQRREWGLQRLPSLAYFLISGEYVEDVLESFPEEGLLPSTLIWLEIKDLPNLKSLNNRGLQHLGSLKNMMLVGCPQLQSLPEEGLPTSLFLLEILECPLLKPRCLREEGQDWHKIARIPLLHTDSELSFDQRNSR
ncbi:putative disease resistance RPP13-like protein 1 [Camellia sinensis]|uniref:putative disease resistance RPP13-like protein 1 n=1 Tax=Camellia sinensis TaxID=4442 RepID=UPI001036E91E|nr:putative disease resistance RPP13-like protein 1 [Camellia sinensis]